jgi:glycerol-3-phosphate acyltransferase PlsX
MFSVALDAMGGDYGPSETVEAALKIVNEYGYVIYLVGDQTQISNLLESKNYDRSLIHIVNSNGVIEDIDNPLKALREKPNASILQAVNLAKKGTVDAVVSMGSTGASMASSSLILGLLEGIERPAIGGPMLRPLSDVVFLDVGSNLDCRPSQLLGFGAIGTVFSAKIQGKENPRVGLLNVGTEANKGNKQIKDAYELFKKSSLNFIGNIESVDLFSDKVDVVICDGFIGNILLKYTEGIGYAIVNKIGSMVSDVLPPELVQKLYKEIADKMNVAEVGGGGPLFGINGIVIVGHGRSKSDSIANGILLAKRAYDVELTNLIKKAIDAL